MVLADLGARLHGALNQLSRASVVDEKVSQLLYHLTRIRSVFQREKNTDLEGDRRFVERVMCRSIGIRCQCQTRLSITDKSQGESKEESRRSRESRRERIQQEECRSKGWFIPGFVPDHRPCSMNWSHLSILVLNLINLSKVK